MPKQIAVYLMILILGCNPTNNRAKEIEDSLRVDSDAKKTLISPSNIAPTDKFCGELFSKVAMCVEKYVGSDGSEYVYSGLGFILNDNYFATCYHIYQHPNVVKFKSIMIYFNFDLVNKKFDTVNIDLKYKARGEQYDFSKHHYDSLLKETDFVILRLAHKANANKVVIANIAPKGKDPVFSFGIKFDGARITERKCENANLIPIEFEQETKRGITIYSYLGNIGLGSSGCPVFNDKGEVIGISTFGFTTYDDLYQKFNSLPALLNIAKPVYSAGGDLGCALDLNFLLRKYGKGYIKN